ncbi:MAG: FtsX-like permease family protein [Firmicutes bacterium]|nr:FtsX-like permease family protein [Bacillota bacterium]
MSLYKIVMQNLARRKTGTLILIIGQAAGIAIAVALFLTVDAARLDLGNQLDEFGANLVIVPRSEGMELSYGGTSISQVSFELMRITEADLPQIREIPDGNSINVVSPKMVSAAELNGKPVILVGVLPHREFLMKPWFEFAAVDISRPEEEAKDPVHMELESDNLLIGAAVAEAMGLGAGDLVDLNGAAFRIAAVFKSSGSTEDGLVYAQLPVVQQLVGKPEELSMIEISAYCNECPVEEIAAQLTAALPNGRVTALGQAALLRGETIERFALIANLLAAAALTAAILLVLTLMTGSVSERTREIGIFRAIGFRRTNIMQIILLEAFTGGFVGGLVGFLAGSMVAATAGFYLAGITGTAAWQWNLLLPIACGSALLAVIAALYPAIKAARLDPLEALRFI